jgi:hypothetical protein
MWAARLGMLAKYLRGDAGLEEKFKVCQSLIDKITALAENDENAEGLIFCPESYFIYIFMFSGNEGKAWDSCGSYEVQTKSGKQDESFTGATEGDLGLSGRLAGGISDRSTA